MLIVCYLCNYFRVNFGNLLDGEIFKFNNGLVSHHQLVMVSINVHDSNMMIYKNVFEQIKLHDSKTVIY